MLASWTLSQRELIRFYRQRSRIVGSLAMPVIVWALLGTGLQAAFPTGVGREAKEFLKYFFPGNLILTLLFTSIFSTISVIEDRNEGFLQSVLVSPIKPLSIVLGKVIGGTFIAVFQGVIFLCLSPLAGFHFGLNDLVYILVTLFSISFSMTALGFLFAWKLDSIQGFHAIMNLVLFPMWLLSGSFFPVESASSVIKPLMLLNPLTYGMSALKMSMMGFSQVSDLVFQLGMLWLFSLGFLIVCVVIVRKKEARVV